MENQPQTRRESQALTVLAMVCYLTALAGVLAFSFFLLSFAMRIVTQQTSFLYSLPV